ncbi:hypothetical protein LXA43DRAFT_1100192 [Ganoderma leucocontextum]|nr:hypothetical protein LXA43DRAFT_1100192 [Ganoderma leucocontextum]
MSSLHRLILTPVFPAAAMSLPYPLGQTPPGPPPEDEHPSGDAVGGPAESSVRYVPPPSHKCSMYRQMRRTFQSANHISDTAPPSQTRLRPTRSSGSLAGKARAIDIPDVGPDDDLSNFLASTHAPNDTAVKCISPLKVDVALLAHATTDFHREYRADKDTLRQDLLKLTAAVAAVQHGSSAGSLGTADDAATLQTVLDHITSLAATVEQNEMSATVELRGFDQHMDDMAGAMDGLRQSCADTNALLQQLCASIPAARQPLLPLPTPAPVHPTPRPPANLAMTAYGAPPPFAPPGSALAPWPNAPF